MNIIKNILGKRRKRKNDWDLDGVPNRFDCQPFNPMRQDDEPLFFGPRRKAKEHEYWAPFKTSEGEQAFVLKKKKISLKEAIDIMQSPWLTYEEAERLVIQKGGTKTLARQAYKYAKGAYKSVGYRQPRFSRFRRR